MSNYQTADREGHGLGYTVPDLERLLGEARREVEAFRAWAQKLLDVSEYVGTDREDASRWQCAFGCGGYSYESVNGTAENDGGYRTDAACISRLAHANLPCSGARC